MSWRLARSLEILRGQVDRQWPARSRVSDGTIGDAAHATRDSDHNPWCGGDTVTAVDITDDPDGGPNMNEVAEVLRESRDPRIKYVIWSGRMFSSYPSSGYAAWAWRPYSGINAHSQHMHVSVQCDASKDSTKLWDIKEREWDEVATKAEIKDAVRDVIKEELKKLAVGTKDGGYDADKVNLKQVLKAARNDDQA